MNEKSSGTHVVQGKDNTEGGEIEFAPLPSHTEEVAKEIVDAAVKVHKTLGPGLLESVYETCLLHELRQRGLSVETQVSVPVVYEGLRLESGLRLDMLVDEEVVVELKAVEVLHPVVEAQLFSYLKLAGHRLGLLLNFNVPVMKRGVRRIIL